MNHIPIRQNAEPQLKLLRARGRVRSRLKTLSLFQVLFTLAIPVTMALFSSFHAKSRPLAAAFALLITILDVWLIDREQKRLMGKMASLAEEFDCTVLDLPWDCFVAGEKLEVEEIHAFSVEYSKQHSDSTLKNWYPEIVGELPLNIARIVCQRTNLHYDSRLRRSFARFLKLGPLILCIAFVFSGLTMNQTLTNWVLTMTPLAPILGWSVREYYRQSDAAETSEILMGNVRTLWNSTFTTGHDLMEGRLRARELQSAIYRRRASSPPIPSFVYRFRRTALEDEMRQGAAHLIDEYNKAVAVSSKVMS